ncbi:histidine kinase [Tepiditoga spiralis]|uniref:histidine kinase n=1 Tax=Tepiditoga spiralis TaxID=2108365 RepID=A0A7G1G1M6_9BACT|nr:sensor histidine kinase [Tepiditoga spiralis]BBE30110.1 histidine kinase [Tepiditoga spiralis]
MKLKIISNYFLDRKYFIILYYFSTILISIYFSAETKKIDIVYPLIMSSYILVIFFLIDFIRYYIFNLHMLRTSKNRYYKIKSYTKEQKNILDTIELVNISAFGEISKIKTENEQKNFFISQWIHNLKTPVSVIDLILQENEEYEFINEIKEENERIKNLLNHLLNIMRLNEFTRDFDPQKYNFYDEIIDIVKEKSAQFIHNEVYPEINGNNKINIIVDKKWNRFLIEQVINNAIKYSDKNKKSKKVIFRLKEKEDIILEIEDNGIGIPEYDINRVFEPFFTGENGKDFLNSSGIGLYTCKLISEKIGAKINIESKLGKGTKIIISYKKEVGFKNEKD